MCGANPEAPVGCNRDSSGQSLATLNYLEIKQIMDRRSTQQNKGKLTDVEIKGLKTNGTIKEEKETSTRPW